jgi:hypothetical protein
VGGEEGVGGTVQWLVLLERQPDRVDSREIVE